MDHLILPSLRRKLPWRGWSVIPGSATYNTPGTFTFVVPSFNTLTVDVRGAGGGGGGWRYSDQTVYYGGTGGNSAFYPPVSGTIIAFGGTGGTGALTTSPIGTPRPAGNPGTASGGDTNTTGGGSAGGVGATTGGTYAGRSGGTGGAGGRAVKTWTRSQQYSQLWKGLTVTVIVAEPGANGLCEATMLNTYSQSGGAGAVIITWS